MQEKTSTSKLNMVEGTEAIKVSKPRIVRRIREGNHESYTFRYSLTKKGSVTNKLLLRDYIELEYIGIRGSLPDFTKAPTSILMIPAFNFLAPLTLFWPINLSIAEIDKDAIESISSLRAAVSDLYSFNWGNFKPGSISSARVVENSRKMHGAHKLVMYSGGVDSYSNIAHNYRKMILGSVEGLEATKGRDNTVTEPAMLVKRLEMARLADKFNTKAVALKFFPYKYLNQRLSADRMKELGIMSAFKGFDFVKDTILHSPIISMFAPYSYLLGCDISIGSSYQPSNDYQLMHKISNGRSCASPELSDALKFGGYKFTEQDGLHQMRTDKLRDIVDFEKIQK